MPPRTSALIVAAGNGARAELDGPKQYARIAGKAVIAHAIDALLPLVDSVQVVIGAGQEAAFAEAIAGRPLPSPIIGGATRQGSVREGLARLEADPPAYVLIHDAARPFLRAGVVERLIEALASSDGAVPVIPVTDTLAHGGAALGDTIPRDGLVRVQTPQAFRFDAIRAAHQTWRGPDATDDAQVARAFGLSVATVAGDPALEKLTYPSDFVAAEARLSAGLGVRTGMGFDVHAFAPGDTVWLGGVPVPHGRTLAGHSDADVALHAITDAILGALAEGDIGDHFPPSDPQWRGARSAIFLEHARDLVLRRGGRIDHVDLTIICEAPKIGPHREAIRASVGAILRLPPGRVSIKATTTERLGFTGRSEGIAAQAIATIRIPEGADA